MGDSRRQRIETLRDVLEHERSNQAHREDELAAARRRVSDLELQLRLVTDSIKTIERDLEILEESDDE